MPHPLIECVPNFSVGRNLSILEPIAASIVSAGAAVLRLESDPDHNRSVVTFAGAPSSVAEAAFQAIRQAAQSIDLREHRGVHPRMGAADVVPFVPLRGASMPDCVRIAHETGQRVWRELGVPVYFYAAAALQPDRVRLENVRRGQFESPALPPDLGGPALHPSAGATILGARDLLVAFNINLATADLGAARRIARKVRASSGGLPFVKALGVPLISKGMAQVSMNLTNFNVTSPRRAFDAVETEAHAEDISISGTQLVGLIPRAAVAPGHRAFTMCEDFGEHRILENRLAAAFPIE